MGAGVIYPRPTILRMRIGSQKGILIGLFNVRRLRSVSEDARQCQRGRNAYQAL
jgi:hypothetical protein